MRARRVVAVAVGTRGGGRVGSAASRVSARRALPGALATPVSHRWEDVRGLSSASGAPADVKTAYTLVPSEELEIAIGVWQRVLPYQPDRVVDASSAAVAVLLRSGALEQAANIASTSRCFPDTYTDVLSALHASRQSREFDCRDRIAAVFRSAVTHGAGGPVELGQYIDDADADSIVKYLESRRQHITITAKRYNQALARVLELELSPHGIPPQARRILSMMECDFARWPGRTVSLLTERCGTSETLIAVGDMMLAKDVPQPRELESIIKAFLRIHADPAMISSMGPTGWWLLNTMRTHSRLDTKVDGQLCLLLMQQLAGAKLLRHCHSAFRFVVEERAEAVPLRTETVLLLIRLCGRLGDRTRSVLDRRTSQKSSKRYSSGGVLMREHRLLESGRGSFQSDFAVRLWKMLEKKAADAGEPHPTLDAHRVLLDTACDRGDVPLMRDMQALIAQRFSMGASTDRSVLWNLARGAVIGESPEMAIALCETLPVEERLSPHHIFKSVNRLSELRCLSMLATFCVESFGNDPNIRQEIDTAVAAACVRIVWYESRRKRKVTGDYGMTAVPIPSLEKLAPSCFDFAPHTGSRMELVAPSGANLTPPKKLKEGERRVAPPRSGLRLILQDTRRHRRTSGYQAQAPVYRKDIYEFAEPSDEEPVEVDEVGAEEEHEEHEDAMLTSRSDTELAASDPVASVFLGAPRAKSFILATNGSSVEVPAATLEFRRDEEVDLARLRKIPNNRLRLVVAERMDDGLFVVADGQEFESLFDLAAGLRQSDLPGSLNTGDEVVRMLAGRLELLELAVPKASAVSTSSASALSAAAPPDVEASSG